MSERLTAGAIAMTAIEGGIRPTSEGVLVAPLLLPVVLVLALAGAGACIPGVDSQQSHPFPVGPLGPPPTFESPINAATPPPPVSGGTLRTLADGRTAVAADPDRDKVFVVDYRDAKLVATVGLEAGDEPGRVIEDAEGRVHVALRRGGAIVTIAPGTWQVVARRAVCAAPRGLAYDGASALLHVACAEGALVSLTADPTGGITRRLPLDGDLRDVVVKGNRVFVSRFRSAEVLVIEGQEIVARLVPPLGQTIRTRIEQTPNGTSGGAGPAAMAPAVAWRMVDDPKGDVLMLHQRALVEEVSVEPGGYAGNGLCSGIVQTTVSPMSPTTPALASAALANVTLAVDLAVSPGGDYLVLAGPGNARQRDSGMQQIAGIRLETLVADSVNIRSGCTFTADPIPVPTAPDVGAADGGTADGGAGDGGAGGTTDGGDSDGPAPPAYPDAGLSPEIVFAPVGEVVAVAFDSGGELLVQTREPATIQVRTRPQRPIVLSAESVLDTGHAIFHANTGAGIACASCHPEGGDDGRVWKFALGSQGAAPRRTQNLHGGILATAPFHWDGTLATVGALMKDVFVGRMGGPQLGADHVQTLTQWMDRIPALPLVPAKNAAAAERGRALFTSAGCVTCHTGPLSTDNRAYDIGRGAALQTPSLRGVAWRAPYMHDGCAATLRDRFSAACGGGDKHGITSTLDEAAIADLVAFLETF